MGWGGSDLPAAPTVAVVAGKKTATGSALPATAAAPVLGDGWELVTVRVRGGAAAITAQPLPPGSSSLPLVAARSISSPLGCGVRPLPGNLLASRFRGGDGLGGGVSCSLVSLVEALVGPWVKTHPGCTVSTFCIFPECLWLLLSLLPFPLLSVWVFALYEE